VPANPKWHSLGTAGVPADDQTDEAIQDACEEADSGYPVQNSLVLWYLPIRLNMPDETLKPFLIFDVEALECLVMIKIRIDIARWIGHIVITIRYIPDRSTF